MDEIENEQLLMLPLVDVIKLVKDCIIMKSSPSNWAIFIFIKNWIEVSLQAKSEI